MENQQNPLLQSDILDLIFAYFVRDPKAFLTFRLVCTIWNEAVTRWIRKTIRWHIDRSGHSVSEIFKERDFVKLLANRYQLPNIFTNFNLSHNNTQLATLTDSFSQEFVTRFAPHIVDLRMRGSRRTYVDYYLPPCAPEVQRLELCMLSRAPFPKGKSTTDFAFANVTYPKLESLTLTGKPHTDTVQLCINMIKNAPNLQALTLALPTSKLCQILNAAQGTTKDQLDLKGLKIFKTVQTFPFGSNLDEPWLEYREQVTAHLPPQQLATLGTICPHLTTITLAIADTLASKKAVLEMLNQNYAKQLLNLELIVRFKDLVDREANEHDHINFEFADMDANGQVHHEYNIIPPAVADHNMPEAVDEGQGMEAQQRQQPPRKRSKLEDTIEFGMFPVLTRLTLQNWSLDNFNMFKKMPSLKFVDLNILQSLSQPWNYPTAGMTLQSKVTKLRFDYCNIIDEQMIETLASTFPHLDDLDISEPCDNANVYVKIWTELPHLKRLKIGDSPDPLYLFGCRKSYMKGSMAEGITGIPVADLKSLPQFYNHTDVDASRLRKTAFIGNMKELEDLTIELSGITQCSIDFGFANMPALRRLKLHMPGNQPTVSIESLLDNCSSTLRTIDIRDMELNCKIKREDIEYAEENHPELEIVYGSHLSDGSGWNGRITFITES